jgi:AcrR family transcriptional regulator
MRMKAPDSDLTPAARIRNAALKGFARDGVASTSIRQVAKAAEVSSGTVQHHFATKATLIEAVNAYDISIVEAAFQDVPAPKSAPAAADELGRRVAALVAEDPEALLYVARASIEENPGALGLFDTFVSIAGKQWDDLAAAGLLRIDIDRQWTALNTVLYNLAPLLFQAAIDRHLPHPFASPDGLARWQIAGTQLFSHGVYTTETKPADVHSLL